MWLKEPIEEQMLRCMLFELSERKQITKYLDIRLPGKMAEYKDLKLTLSHEYN